MLYPKKDLSQICEYSIEHHKSKKSQSVKGVIWKESFFFLMDVSFAVMSFNWISHMWLIYFFWLEYIIHKKLKKHRLKIFCYYTLHIFEYIPENLASCFNRSINCKMCHKFAMLVAHICCDVRSQLQ